jgi:hypothetical protein
MLCIMVQVSDMQAMPENALQHAAHELQPSCTEACGSMHAMNEDM